MIWVDKLVSRVRNLILQVLVGWVPSHTLIISLFSFPLSLPFFLALVPLYTQISLFFSVFGGTDTLPVLCSLRPFPTAFPHFNHILPASSKSYQNFLVTICWLVPYLICILLWYLQHTDISFEPVPADYSMLQLRTIPKSGGDTMWSSMYSAYDALSPAMKKFLEGMTAVHDAEDFREQSAKWVHIHFHPSKRLLLLFCRCGNRMIMLKFLSLPTYYRFGFPLYSKERGHPENVGDRLQTSHPVIRTNPVTGYKALFVNRSFTKRINELSIDESDALLAYLFKLVAESFDFQARFRWKQDDIALWDNRSSQHSGIFDFGKAKRVGDRCVSIGEKPFLDAVNSKSRAEDLAGGKTEWEI